MIRLARRDDLETMCAIEREAGTRFRELGMDAVAEDPPPSIDALLAFQREDRAWIAAVPHDHPVGYALATIVDGNAHLEQVSVRPDRARRGLGRELIDAVESWGRYRRCALLTLTTFDRVPWNRPYYERLGFTVVDQRDLTPELTEIRLQEARRGLDRWPRVAMKRPIAHRGRPSPAAPDGSRA